jgi:hypothetical protein
MNYSIQEIQGKDPHALRATLEGQGNTLDIVMKTTDKTRLDQAWLDMAHSVAIVDDEGKVVAYLKQPAKNPVSVVPPVPPMLTDKPQFPMDLPGKPAEA